MYPAHADRKSSAIATTVGMSIPNFITLLSVRGLELPHKTSLIIPSFEVRARIGPVMSKIPMDTKTSRRLADGDSATWSPDGEWIALNKGKDYWLLDWQSGTGKVLFKQKNRLSPLWWSPDSKYVAYATRVGLYVERCRASGPLGEADSGWR
jgi:hypothetical protein